MMKSALNRKIIILIILFCAVSMHSAGHLGFVLAESSKEDEALFVAKKAFEDGFYEVSLGLLERFLQSYPSSPKVMEAQLLAGQCYFYQNNYLEALNKFEWLLNQPQAANLKDAVVYWIAEVHFKGSNFDKAATYYKWVVEEFPKSSYLAASFYSLGWCLFKEQKFNEALAYFKNVTEKFPGEPFAQEAHLKIIECLSSLKDYAAVKDKAKAYINTYSKDASKLAFLYFYSAEADYYLNNFEEAVSEYAKAIQFTKDPKVLALVKLGLGWTYVKLKKYPEAKEAFASINDKDLEKKSLDVLTLGKAMLMAETDSLTEASELYGKLINSTSDPVILAQGYVGKADVLYTMAEYKQAINVYQEALSKISQGVTQELQDKLYYGLAWAYLKEGDFKPAIEAFQKMAKQSEDKIIKISALCQIGDVYQDSGDYKKAIETYDAILNDYPDSYYSDYAQYQLGSAFLKSSNYDGAIMAFRNLKSKYPNSKLQDEASYALGLTYFQREDFSASKEIFEKFQDQFKDSALRPQAMYLWGTSLYNQGKFSEAIEVFKNVIRSYSYDIELMQKAEYEIADCYYQLGDEKEAMTRFKSLRSKYPDSKLTAEVIWWLGEYYYKQNNFDLAQRYFTSIINDHPKSGLIRDTYYILGSMAAEQSKFPEAIANFQRVIELGRSDLAAQAGIAMGDIYVKLDKIDDAFKAYKEVASLYSNFTHLVYPKVASLYVKIANYDEATNFYRKSLDLVPVREMSDIQFRLAESYEAQGKIDNAIEEYLKVTYLYSEASILTVKALLRVAAIYEAKENFKEALNIYRKVVSTGSEEAKYALERIDWIKENVKK